MKTWVSKRLQDPNNTSVSSADVGELINSALDLWKNTRFYFNERTDTATLTESDATIPLPDDWFCPALDDGAFVIEYSGIRYPLKKLAEPVYNAAYLSNGIGQPMWYSRQANEEYQCYPIPDQAYTIRRFYLKDYDAFSSDSDTNDFSEKATNLLQYTAAAYGSRDFLQDEKMYSMFWQQAQTELKDLLSTTKKDNATGSLTASSVLLC